MKNLRMPSGARPGSLVAVVVLATTLAAMVPLSSAARRSAPVTVASRDGLAMTLSRTGRVTSVQIGNREVSGGRRAPLFSVRRVGRTPNLLPNPSLESDADHDGVPDDWSLM